MTIKQTVRGFYYKYLDVKWYLFILLLLSIFIIVDIRLEFFHVSKIFPEVHLFKFKNDFYNISMAYITSFIFYYLVVFLGDKNRNEMYKMYVREQINDIFRNTSWVISDFLKNNSKDGNQLPAYDELKKLVDKTKPSGCGSRGFLTPTGSHHHSTIWEDIINLRIYILHVIDKISLRAPSFDSKLTHYLMRIEKCTLYYILYQLETMKSFADLSFMSDAFIEYIKILDDMGEYTSKKYGSFTLKGMFNK